MRSPRPRAGRGRKLVRREVVLDHAVVHMELDTERDAKGREHTYVWGTGPDIAFVVPLWGDGTVTLNRQYRFGMRRPSVELPGGHVDEGESPEEGALRELEEETGLVARRLTPLVTCMLSAKIQQRVHVFLGENLGPGRRHLDEDEEIELLRMPLTDAMRLARRSGVLHGPSLLGLFAAQDHLARRRRPAPRGRA